MDMKIAIISSKTADAYFVFGMEAEATIATQLIDDSNYPEVVLCEFADYNGKKHKFDE